MDMCISLGLKGKRQTIVYVHVEWVHCMYNRNWFNKSLAIVLTALQVYQRPADQQLVKASWLLVSPQPRIRLFDHPSSLCNKYLVLQVFNNCSIQVQLAHPSTHLCNMNSRILMCLKSRILKKFCVCNLWWLCFCFAYCNMLSSLFTIC